MIIKISELPVIDCQNARIVGKMSGIMMQSGKIEGILFLPAYRNDDGALCYRYAAGGRQVALEHIHIGPHAVMLQDRRTVTLQKEEGVCLQGGSGIYDMQGEWRGSIHAVEADREGCVRGVYAGDQYIPFSSVQQLGDVCLLKEEEAADQPAAPQPGQDCLQEEENRFQPLEVQGMLEEAAPWPDIHPEETTDVLNPRYHYLIGKKLVNDLHIHDEVYVQGTVIDRAMLLHSLESNHILNLIMSAED